MVRIPFFVSTDELGDFRLHILPPPGSFVFLSSFNGHSGNTHKAMAQSELQHRGHNILDGHHGRKITLLREQKNGNSKLSIKGWGVTIYLKSKKCVLTKIWKDISKVAKTCLTRRRFKEDSADPWRQLIFNKHETNQRSLWCMPLRASLDKLRSKIAFVPTPYCAAGFRWP